MKQSQYISFQIYQVHTVNTMVFCVDTGAPHFCIGNKALERIFRHFGRKSIPIIDPERDFKSSDTLVGSRGVVEHVLPAL